MKRLFDLVVTVVALVPLMPVALIIAALALAAQGRPLFFVQRRVGLGGEIFRLPKFRSMRDLRDEAGLLLPDEQRTTWIGRFLRRSRLDELPGFLPVLAGQMSLVGPRPLPPEVLESIPGSQARSRIRPGFTGLAQVAGNTLLTNEEKLALDLYYGRIQSIGLDVTILAKTAWTILFGERRNEALIARALAASERPLPDSGAGARR